MVSHDLNLTSQVADRVLVLNKGEAVACGSPAEVLRRDVLEPVYGCRFAIDTPAGSRHPRISPMRE
jgi:iron complex transport system ATP-binding protein